MAILTVSPSFVNFYGNYHGNTLFCRNGQILCNRKISRSFFPVPKTDISKVILSRSATAYASLLSEEKNSFICYYTSTTGRKSGLNACCAVNINLNYAVPVCFSIISSISLCNFSLSTPEISGFLQNHIYKYLRVSFTSSEPSNYRIKFYSRFDEDIYYIHWFGYPSLSWLNTNGFTYLGYCKVSSPYKQFDCSNWLSHRVVYFTCCVLSPDGTQSNFSEIKRWILVP
jgi:hypothetical protein